MNIVFTTSATCYEMITHNEDLSPLLSHWFTFVSIRFDIIVHMFIIVIITSHSLA